MLDVLLCIRDNIKTNLVASHSEKFLVKLNKYNGCDDFIIFSITVQSHDTNWFYGPISYVTVFFKLSCYVDKVTEEKVVSVTWNHFNGDGSDIKPLANPNFFTEISDKCCKIIIDLYERYTCDGRS